MELGERIRALRELRGISQGELSKRSGVSRAYVWQLESANHSLGYKILKRLAAALEIPLPFLVDDQLWANKTPKQIASRGGLALYLESADVSEVEKTSLSIVAEKAGPNLPRDLDGWRVVHEAFKVWRDHSVSISKKLERLRAVGLNRKLVKDSKAPRQRSEKQRLPRQ